MNADLWNPEIEKSFFNQTKTYIDFNHLFYKSDDNRYFAYWPKSYKGKKYTLQSRNAYIGDYTEKWSKELISSFFPKNKLFVVQKAICNELALHKKSPADLVIARKNEIVLEPDDILVIFEVKMSIVWNWEKEGSRIVNIGDFETHQGNPGLLRSDTMLKAIGKSINIRISSPKAARIPIIVLGNTPITKSYEEKVDHLRTAGIIQGFWSINPKPLDIKESLIKTTSGGFIRFDTVLQFEENIKQLLNMELNYFSGMMHKENLGRIIEIADKETSYERKAEVFLELLQKG